MKNGSVINNTNVFESFDCEMYQAVAALTRVNTPFKAKNSLIQNPLYVPPEMIPLSYRRETHLNNGNSVSNKLIAEQFSYMSIIKTIKSLFSDKEFANLILNEVIDRSPFFPRGCYENFTDGSFFRTHSLFSDPSKTALRIQIFYDGMGTTNPLRGHSAPHNLGIFYFTIQNLPNSFNTCYPNIHTFAMCHTLDLKKNGFAAILDKFVEEMTILENEGIIVDIPDVGSKLISAAVSKFSGDCLATNEIFGLISDFSHNYHCPHCYCLKEIMSTKFRENDFILRTRAEHAKDLKNLAESSNDVTHVRGVKENSALNYSKSFHSSESLSMDLMHIMPEGNLPYETSCYFYEILHVRKSITLDELNRRIRNLFSILEVDKGNTPAELNDIKTPGGGLSPKLTANECLCLFRNLPYLVGDCVQENDKHWELILQLQDITDIVFAPKITDHLLEYFSELYEKHLILFKKLYPLLPIKPKQHYLIHFPASVRKNGPPTYSSCFKYELKNSYFKRICHITCNFRNIAMTLSVRNQLVSLAYTLNNDRLRNKFVKTHKFSPVRIRDLQGSNAVSVRLKLRQDDIVYCSTKASIGGRNFAKGNAVITGKVPMDCSLQFSEIISVLCHNNESYLLVKELRAVGFDYSMHCYNVKEKSNPEFFFLTPLELLDFHPLDICKQADADDHLLFIRLRYLVI